MGKVIFTIRSLTLNHSRNPHTIDYDQDYDYDYE